MCVIPSWPCLVHTTWYINTQTLFLTYTVLSMQPILLDSLLFYERSSDLREFLLKNIPNSNSVQCYAVLGDAYRLLACIQISNTQTHTHTLVRFFNVCSHICLFSSILIYSIIINGREKYVKIHRKYHIHRISLFLKSYPWYWLF